jgi:hypothetical protein
VSRDSTPVIYRSSFPLIPILLGGVGGALAYSYGYGVVGISVGALLGALTPITTALCAFVGLTFVAGALAALVARGGR